MTLPGHRIGAGGGPGAAVRGLDSHRVAEVIVTTEDARRQRGSGYRITTDLVLTAAHVVDRASSLLVRFDAETDDEWSAPAEVIWAPSDPDLAIVRIASAFLVPPAAAVEFARIPAVDAEVRCSTVGFPRFKLRRDQRAGDDEPTAYRDSCHRFGAIAPFSHIKQGTLEVRVDRPEYDDDRNESPWAGMSGAPVFVGRHIVGVVSEHHRPDGLGTLTAVRITRLHAALTRSPAPAPGSPGSPVDPRAPLTDPQPALADLCRSLAELPLAQPEAPVWDDAAGHRRRPIPAASTSLFISHDPGDQQAAEQLARDLEAHGLRPSLHSRRLDPAVPARSQIQRVLLAEETVAVLFGTAGLEDWPVEELRVALERAVRSRNDVRVVPVLLPGCPTGERSELSGSRSRRRSALESA
jgi:hypothetical protein